MFLLLSGQMTLPVDCLIEPVGNRLIRPIDRDFVNELKEEMLLNPTSDVAPMIGVVYTDQFNRNQPEAYKYETIGGNHSRTALLELLEEDPTLATNSCYTRRTVSIYQNLSHRQAKYLAQKHNRATSFTHSMTTQDYVRVPNN